MSHFGCICGNSIVDITDFLPYKAHFLPDEDTETALDPVVNLLAESIEAREQGKQDEFLARQRLPPRFADDLRNLLRNMFSHPTFKFGRDMYECEECGRIWMEARPDTNDWVSYLPESARRGILRHQGAAPDE